MSRRVTRLLLLIVIAFLMVGNVPAPWAPCEGKKEGDPCHYGYTSCVSGQRCARSDEVDYLECRWFNGDTPTPQAP